jgi:hypothetical protein
MDNSPFRLPRCVQWFAMVHLGFLARVTFIQRVKSSTPITQGGLEGIGDAHNVDVVEPSQRLRQEAILLGLELGDQLESTHGGSKALTAKSP